MGLGIVAEVINNITSGGSELIDREHIGFYTKFKETTSQYRQDDKRADANLLLYAALIQYIKYDRDIQDFVRQFYYGLSDVVYDENNNGYYSAYNPDWTPKEIRGIYELSLSDAILAATVFLDEEELVREIRAQGS